MRVEISGKVQLSPLLMETRYLTCSVLHCSHHVNVILLLTVLTPLNKYHVTLIQGTRGSGVKAWAFQMASIYK